MANEQSIPEAGTTGRKRRQVTAQGFALLLAALGDTAGGGAQYEKLRAKLVFFFSRRLLAFPEDLADEVLDRLAHRLSEGLEVVSAEAFALGIARHVALEQAGRKAQAVDPSFFDNVSAPTVTPGNEEEIVRLERCLKKLSSAEARLLRGYYLVTGNNLMASRKSLAEKLGVSPVALRQRVFLARQQLRQCMTPDVSK